MPPKSGPNSSIDEHASHGSKGQERGLSLVWVFPTVDRAPVPLLWNASSNPGGELSFGRDPTCDVCIVSKQVSRRHAVVTQSGAGRVRITDLESRNGTRLNGRRVVTAELASGDVIRLGSWVGVVTEGPSHFRELAPGLLGGATLQAALGQLLACAESLVSVVIEGETGTGKKTVARGLHTWSGRSGAFVVVDCSAIPHARVESEFFGDDEGSPSGAPRPSLLVSAHRGTLVLDHIASLSLSAQARLLDALTQQVVRPLGDVEPVAIDLRIVVTAQEPLIGAVREGRLRQDLLAHLDIAGLPARLPPLRQRREDIAGIFLDLLHTLTDRRAEPEVSPDLIERLCLHTWPFNVRELVGLTRRLVTLHGNEALLSEKHLPDRFSAVATDPFPADERKTT